MEDIKKHVKSDRFWLQGSPGQTVLLEFFNHGNAKPHRRQTTFTGLAERSLQAVPGSLNGNNRKSGQTTNGVWFFARRVLDRPHWEPAICLWEFGTLGSIIVQGYGFQFSSAQNRCCRKKKFFKDKKMPPPQVKTLFVSWTQFKLTWPSWKRYQLVSSTTH